MAGETPQLLISANQLDFVYLELRGIDYFPARLPRQLTGNLLNPYYLTVSSRKKANLRQGPSAYSAQI